MFPILFIGDDIPEHACKEVKAREAPLFCIKGSCVFTTLLHLQLLAYCIAQKRGNNIDRPRNLAKCVTVL